MRKILAAAAVVLAALPAVRALDGKLFFTLAPNVEDEFRHIMPHRPPHVSNVVRCVRRQPVTLVLLLRGPATGKDGAVRVEVESVETVDPGGKKKVLVRPEEHRVLLKGVRKTPRDFAGVMLAPLFVTLIVEDGDPLGKYRFAMRIRDLGDGSELALAAEIAAVEQLPGAPEKPMTTGEMSKFITHYYRQPDPAKIPAAFAAFLRYDIKASGSKKHYDPLASLCAFAELYKLNPQLRPALAAGAAGYSTIHKQYVAMILAQAGAEDSELAGADPELKQLFARFNGKKPLSFAKVVHPAQLDALWTTFFVTGRVEPIRRLVGELGKRTDVMTAAEVKKLGRKPTREESAKVMNGLIGRMAEWSLASNAKQHRLAAYYLEAMLMRNMYPDREAAVKLGGMLINAGLLEVREAPGGKKTLGIRFPERRKVEKDRNP